jgi:RNA polymerase sigma factor (sigma-70 family)
MENSDLEMLRLILDGQEAGMCALIVRYVHDLRRILISRFPKVAWQDIEDAIQETLIDTWKLADRAIQYNSLGGWLLSCAENKLKDILRKPSKRYESQTADPYILELYWQNKCAQALSAKSQHQLNLIANAVDQLSPLERRVFDDDLMNGGRPAVELADEFGTSQNSVIKARCTGRARIKKLLGLSN